MWGDGWETEVSILQKPCYQECDYIRHLNHRINCRAGGVFVWIADSITGNGRFVSIRTLATIIAVFNKFLSVVPSGSPGSHRYGNKQTGYDCSDKKSAQSLRAKNKTNKHRN